MKLKDYLKGLPAEDAREDFARRCGTALGHLRNVMYGYKPCAADLAVAVWQQSDGVVTRQELRPDDWQKFWPELVAAEV